MARFDLTDTEWSIIAPLLPNKPRGVPRVDDRRVVNGIFYILRTGSPWRDLPERYGPYTTVYNRYNRWARTGVWLRAFELGADLLVMGAYGHSRLREMVLGGATRQIGRAATLPLLLAH